jgi:uncharacterized protein
MVDELWRLLHASPVAATVLERVADLDLPDWYLGAGTVCATVWNDAHGFDPAHGIKDLDVVYFDAAGDREAEAAVEARVRDALADVGIPVDVTNEAIVHTWYEDRLGVTLDPPYTSTCDAITTWPTTASSIGVRPGSVCAPFGLDDLFGLVVRPNVSLITPDVFEAKAARAAAVWPRLTILGWDDGARTDRLRSM